MTRPTYQGFALPAGAADVRYTVTRPNGTTASVVCTTSPCDLSALDRRGRPLVLVEYRDGSENVIKRATRLVELK